MRILVLIALLLAFTAGSYADVAHAYIQDHTCTHHQINQDDDADNEPCHSEQDKQQCDDCCCVHVHTMAVFTAPVKTEVALTKRQFSSNSDSYYSYELSSLYRPPRL